MNNIKLLATADMQSGSRLQPHRFGQRLRSSVRALLAVLITLAALAVPTRSLAQAPTFNTLITTYKGDPNWAHPVLAAMGDFNGDGKLDSAVFDGTATIHLLLGNNTGAFAEHRVDIPLITASNAVGLNSAFAPYLPHSIDGVIRAIKAVDVNGDGKLDIVCLFVVHINFAPLWGATVLINQGNDANGVPQFTTATHYFSPFADVRSLTIGDLNGDGKPDFIVGDAFGDLQVYLNNGDGTFTAGQSMSILQPNPNGSVGFGVIADLNGDGKADYVVTDNQSGATDVFWGNGDGTFQTTPLILPNNANSIAVADVNGDGKLDLLAVENGSPNQLVVYLNSGGGSFSAPTRYSTGGTAWNGWTAVTTADMNGDGKLDVVVANSGGNNVSVFLGDESGTFGAPALFPVNVNPLDVAVGDFNGDGKPDIATVGTSDDTYGVLLNTTVFAPPLPTQTLTILGGVGNVGGVAANVEYYNPATGLWQSAYLVGQHPWGEVADTTSWINYKPSNLSDPGAGPTTANTLWYLYRVRFTVPSDAQNPKMTFSVKADNFAQVAINGATTGPVIVGQADQLNADAVFSQSVHPGENTITINVGDFGGLNGFNFRIDLSMEASQPLEIVPVAPADTIPPAITAPANITVEATGPNGAVVTFTATAQDNVDGAVNVTASPASGSTFPLGTTHVGLAASDAAHNTATASFDVTVRDTTPPVISAPGTVTAEATSSAGATVIFVATANDVVSGNVSVTANPPSGSTFVIGFSLVSLSATDAAGNTATQNILIVVRDTIAPALTVPANQVIEATSAAGAVATFAASATDAVGVRSLTYSAASGSPFPIGTTTVTVIAKDAANNTSSGLFTVTVRDTTAPVIASLTASSTSLWPPNHKMVPITLTAVTSDAVGVASLKIIGATSNEPDNGLGDGDTANDIEITGALTLNLRAERSGTGNGRIYTITVEAKDAVGNATTKTVTVSVPKSQGGK